MRFGPYVPVMFRRAVTKVFAVSVVVGIAAVGCSDSSTEGPTEVLPTQDLVDALLAEDDLDGTWTVSTGPRDGGEFTSGAVTDANRDKLPQMELCDSASEASREAIRAVEWRAFRQIDKTADDPIDMPKDREGHMVFVQQWLTSGDADQLESRFVDISVAFRSCLGEIPAGEEGPGTISEIEIEPIGDQRFAVLTRFEEAGSAGFWNIYSVLVRTGTVLMSMTAVDIVLGDTPVESELPDLDELLSTALSKL